MHGAHLMYLLRSSCSDARCSSEFEVAQQPKNICNDSFLQCLYKVICDVQNYYY